MLSKTETNAPQKTHGEVTVAGRITNIRYMGKASFMDIQDISAPLQIYVRQDMLGGKYDMLKELDLGDFIGVTGEAFLTKTEAPTIAASTLVILSKSLRPPPEKWHGLRDVEQRYRHREADLLSNSDTRARFILRSKIIQAIRTFLDARDFIEVETPVMLSVAAGAMATPFITHHNALDRTLYMRIATELHLKRCIIGGLEKVYEIGRVFRNEGLDANHNPEFTTLESYQSYADYLVVMETFEAMIAQVMSSVLGTTKIPWKETVLDFNPPWQRLDLRATIKNFSGIDLEAYSNPVSLSNRMRSLGITVTQEVSWGRLVDKLISETIEPQLLQPTFIIDYPVEMSPLAKRKPDDPDYTQRFEAFAGGMEIANAFSELNDPNEQRNRFAQQEQLRKEHDSEEFDRLDEDFLEALEYGMPPTGGLGMGIDRLVMLLSNQPTIREVVLFPHLSRSQAELFREITQRLEELTRDQESDSLESLIERLKKVLPLEIGQRVTDEELHGRVTAFLSSQDK